MRCLIVSCVFLPEPVLSSRTSTDLANELCRNGHQVRVITAFPNRPAGKLYIGYKRKPWTYDKSFVDYDVLRCFSLFSSESSLISRFLENLSFGLTSGLVVLFSEKPDVIYGNTWPIFAQGILALICYIRGIPLVMSVQDIYPETLTVQGRAGKLDFFYQKPLRWLDKKVKQNCAAIAVISEQFRQIYAEDRRIPNQKIHLIPNWINERQLQIDATDNSIRRMHNIPENAFLIVYAGNISLASGLNTIIHAFQKLIDKSSIYLLIAGDGSMLANCRELARKMGNPRVLFHTPWLESETASLLSAATLFILPTPGEQSLFSVPSQLIFYMLAGHPVLSCVEGKSEVARIINTARCGWIVAAAEPETIAEKLCLLSQDSQEELDEYGKRGREYAVKEMTRTANLPKLIKLIDSVAYDSER